MTHAEQAPSIMLRCVGITKEYTPSGAGAHDVSLEVKEGQILALVGPSGCGKTTLLRVIAGLESPAVGTVEVDGRTVTGRDVFVEPEHRSVGFVFQDYALFPHMTVEANIAYGLPRRHPNREQRVNEMLNLVHLSDLRTRRPHELSGGERQRVALARALAPAPKILLLDEPFSNLDPTLSSQLQVEVQGILREAGITVIFVTHDQKAALSMGDVIAVMNNGRVQQVGTPDDTFHSPLNRFVAAFLGEADFISVQGVDYAGRVVTEIGDATVSASSWSGDPRGLSLMVRPEDVAIDPSNVGNGRVIGRTFSGAFYTYTVELVSGAECRAMTSHATTIDVGTRVSVRIAAGHPLPVFPSSSEAAEAPV